MTRGVSDWLKIMSAMQLQLDHVQGPKHVFASQLPDRGLSRHTTYYHDHSRAALSNILLVLLLQVAQGAAEVALRPFFGIYGPYSAASDPWAIPANRAFLHEFYSKALSWLSDPGNKTYKVASVFIWSMASWDVLGIYPESTTAQGSYRDPVNADAIKKYNRGVVTAQGGKGGGTTGSSGVSSKDGEVIPAAGK